VLSGEIPDAAAIPAGCRFEPRCPIAVPECRDIDPVFVAVGAAHTAACIRAEISAGVSS